jgi:TonB-dependent receptor
MMTGLIRTLRRLGPGVLLALGIPVFGQEPTGAGSVFGQVREADTGVIITNVTVSIAGTPLRSVSGSDGRYSILMVPAGVYEVAFTRSDYERLVQRDVRVVAGEATSLDVQLRLPMFELELLEIMADPLGGLDAELRLERQGSASFVDAIGSDMFSRLAAGDAAEIMTKVTGVSVVEGKFAVIRGLSDRYNLALLNGADVPSADPNRKAAQLDLFPADVIQSVVVSKTFTPNLPGGFAGGSMDIRTKSFPEKFLFKTSLGVGYNTQSTFNDEFRTYPGGGRDTFAMDDGTRALPAELRNVSGSDLTALLQTATSCSLSISLEKKTAAAAELDRLVRSFDKPQMGSTKDAPPLDQDFNLTMGDTLKLGNNEVPLGYFAGVSYERDFRHYDDGTVSRFTPRAGDVHKYQDWQDTRSTTLAQWSAMANLATRLFDNHELAYTFLISQNAEDQVRTMVGQVESSGEDQFNDERRTHRNTLHWTERNLTFHQIRGGHSFPEWRDFQADWLVSLADTSQEEPDLRFFNFISFPNPADPTGPLRGVDLISNNTPFPDRPTRYFRTLEEQNFSPKVDFTLPLDDWRGLKWEFKTGGLLSESERTLRERTFSYSGGSGSLVDTETFPFEYMLGTNAPPPRLVVQNNRPRYVFSRTLDSRFGNNFYDGVQDIFAVYAMAEVPLTENLRLVGGVRYEDTFLEVTSSAFQSSQSFTGRIDQGDLLPAVSLLWEFRPGMNFRLSYAETIARPTYREFARFRSFDTVLNQEVEGNPFLKMTQIQNADARWEWFTEGGGLISFGGFLKLLQDPIEKFNATLTVDGDPIWTSSGDFVTFLNTDEATVWGLEFEARQNLGFLEDSLSPFSVGVNFTYIDTAVELQPDIQQLKFAATGERVTTRPLYDQSPYILNADLSYDNPDSGTSVTLAFYYAAERLALIANGGWDIYEQPAPNLDLIISQRLWGGIKGKFTARNLLNPEIQNTYAVNGATDTRYVYSSYTKGITFGLSLSYEF